MSRRKIGFFRWLIGVTFIGRPIGVTFEEYDEWLLGEDVV